MDGQVRFVNGERLCPVLLGSAAEAAIEAANAEKFVRIVARSKAEPLLELVEELWRQVVDENNVLLYSEELEPEEHEEDEEEWNVANVHDDDDEIRPKITTVRVWRASLSQRRLWTTHAERETGGWNNRTAAAS
jgi:hypothetical protein